MLIITVDIGSYSLKILHSKPSKKLVRPIAFFETQIPFEKNKDNLSDYFSFVFEKIKEHMDQIPEENKLIINIPSTLVTSRQIMFPVGQKKKAKMMLPFKLEEDIPYSLNSIHYAERYIEEKKECEALVNICRKEHFQMIYELIGLNLLRPFMATTDVSAMDLFINKQQDLIYPDSFCIIDLGHEASKIYFFNNKKLVSSHISFVAGKTVNEQLAQNYNCSIEEAKKYKHEHAFFLTSGQFDLADEEQKTFAKIMDKTFRPFILDFKRMELGHKVSTGKTISKIVLIGGTSQIKNIENYLSENLEVEVEMLRPIQFISSQIGSGLTENVHHLFNLSNMASATINRTHAVNLLSGDFAIQGQGQLPLISYAFMATKMAILSFVLAIPLGVEQFLLRKNLKEINTKMLTILKNPTLNLTPRVARSAATNPQLVYSTISRTKRALLQEVQTLKSTLAYDTLSILDYLANLGIDKSVEITQFKSNYNQEFEMALKVQNEAQIGQLKSLFENPHFQIEEFKENAAELNITLKGLFK